MIGGKTAGTTGRIWLAACEAFSTEHGVQKPYFDALHAFAYPNPRGGPPPPPEPRWAGDFASLEAALCPTALATLDCQRTLVEDLEAEVDTEQAAIFARRIAAVETQLIRFDDPTGRLLRVGLRQRLHGILRAPRPRALRVRALADFFYSFAGRWLHGRARHSAAATIADAVAAARWESVAAGVASSSLDGVFDGVPTHVNLLRLEAGSVQTRIVDCREAVGRGVSFEEHATALGAVAAISGGFFLYSEPDIEPPCARFDPVGMLVDAGTVVSPPVFARGALTVDAEGGWGIGRVGPEGYWVHGAHASMPLAGCTTRAEADVGPPCSSVSFARREVVAVGESLPVPVNGFVVAASDPGAWSPGEAVTYRSDASRPIRSAIAGGPLLVQGGAVDLDLRAEGFWGTAPPRTFSQDETGDRNSLPRLAVGLDAQSRLIIAAVDGRNFDRALGMTLGELAALMMQLGCVVATNLDGGSSKRMVIRGRSVDLSSTEIEDGPRGARIRPVHTGVLFVAR